MRYNAESFNPNKTIKKVRELSGKSQKEFAEYIGISETDLQNIENRKDATGISIIKYLEWCDHADCDINYLLGHIDLPEIDTNYICLTTGLDEYTVDLLKKEQINPITSEIRNKKNAVVIGISTADLLNQLSSLNGSKLKDTMIQYIREASVAVLLKESVQNIIDNHNNKEGRSDSVESIVQYAENILSSIRLVSSLSSLTVTGRMQKQIDDDFTSFWEKMKKDHYNKTDSRVLFDYMQSIHRLDALKMTCYNLLIKFMDSLSDENQLKLHSQLGDNEFDITSSKIYEVSIEDIEQSKKDQMIASLNKKVKRYATKDQKNISIKNSLLEDNCRKSNQLVEAKRRIIELENTIDHIPADKKKYANISAENDDLRRVNKDIFDANQRLDKRVKELEEELKQLKTDSTDSN